MVGDSYGSNSAGADGVNWFFDFGPYTAGPLGYSITNQNTLRTETIHVQGTLMPPGQYTFTPTFSTSTESFLTGDSSSVGFSYDSVISFVAVPEPNSAALVTSTIAGLCFFRRRPNGVDPSNGVRF
jgi:hypothetical protein